MPRLTVTERAQIPAFLADGWKHRELAQKFNCTLVTIAKWANRKDLADRPRPGAPKKLNPQQEKALLKAVKDKRRKSTRKMAQPRGVSHVTVYRTLRGAGLHPYKTRAVPLLTEKNRAARRKIVKLLRGQDWKKVAAYDETMIDVIPRPNPQNDRVWAAEKPAGGKPVPKFGGGSIRIAMAVSYFGKTRLHFYPEKLNSASYQEILKTTIIPFLRKNELELLHDSDPSHTSKSTKAFLKQQQVKVVADGAWPGNSPDLNIIENCNAYLKDKVGKECHTLGALKRACNNAWNHLPQKDIQNMFDSMPRRLAAVRKANGGNTDY